MPFQVKFTDRFERQIDKIGFKNPVLHEAILKKLEHVVQNPRHYKPLRSDQWGYRRVHFGSFVLKYALRGDTVIIVELKHHDRAYD